MTGILTHRRKLALMLALCLSGPLRLYAEQIADESEIKAALLYNFAKFTEWPADAVPANATLTLCVVGDWFVAQSLEKATNGKEIGGHPVVVRRMKNDGALRSCQLLYAGRVDQAHALELLVAVDGVAVLTVSDLTRFTKIGGTAEFFVDGDRMRFAVNMESARRFRVHLSAQLLSLAKLVKAE